MNGNWNNGSTGQLSLTSMSVYVNHCMAADMVCVTVFVYYSKTNNVHEVGANDQWVVAFRVEMRNWFNLGSHMSVHMHSAY